MKTLFILLTVFLISTTTPKSVSFCSGWEIGYVEGYNFNQDIEGLTPLIPLCPLPKINKDTYTDGYVRGVIQGKEDYENQ